MVVAVSLVAGPVPITVGVFGFAAMVAAVFGGRNARWWLPVPLFAASLAVVIVAARLVPWPRSFGSSFPPSFYLWAALPIFDALLAIVPWSHWRAWRRVVAAASVPLLLVFGALQLDAFYGYLPTLNDVLHGPLPGQVPAHQLFAPPVREALEQTVAHRAHLLLAQRHAATVTGTIAQVDIPAPVSHFHHRRGWVWLPPAWYEGARALPVLVLLAGAPGEPGDWLRGGGALDVANHWAVTHDGFAPIMVLPDENGSFASDTECVDGPLGNAETYLTADVPHYVMTAFGASRSPDHWAVVGLSEGGTCAFDLVLRHPGVYRVFGDFSGDLAPNLGNARFTLARLFGGSYELRDAYTPLRLLRTRHCGAGWIDAGQGDRHATNIARTLAVAARAAGMAMVRTSRPGGHTFWVWHAALADAYPWIVAHIDSGDTCVTARLAPRP
jgi:S-formylglutathione hydrolase FrmB